MSEDDKPQWTEDCNGKQSYEVPIVLASIRLYPGESFYGKRPSAMGWLELGGETIAEIEIECDTEHEVKSAAEKWVDEHVDTIRLALRGE